jgi:hypothetical protein
MSWASTVTSGGARAGAATKSYSLVSTCKRKKGHESADQRSVADQFPGKPQERLLEVVVGLGGDVVVLEVLLAVESDGLGLDLALLDVDLVTAQDDGDILADTDEVTFEAGELYFLVIERRQSLTVPVGNVLVGDTGGHIEHDDTALSVDIVSISQTTELLLTSSVPHIELDCAEVLFQSLVKAIGIR